jgi:hypothetical protein
MFVWRVTIFRTMKAMEFCTLSVVGAKTISYKTREYSPRIMHRSNFRISLRSNLEYVKLKPIGPPVETGKFDIQ